MLAKNSEQGKQNPRTEMGYDACQEWIICKVTVIRAGQSEFRERIMATTDKLLKNIMVVVNWQTKNLHDEFNSDLQVTWQTVEERHGCC
jgi:hypothetical protein